MADKYAKVDMIVKLKVLGETPREIEVARFEVNVGDAVYGQGAIDGMIAIAQNLPNVLSLVSGGPVSAYRVSVSPDLSSLGLK